MLAGLYVITNGGLPLYTFSDLESESPDGDIDGSILFSGLITAVKSFLVKINVGEVNSFSTSTHDVLMYQENTFAYVFIIDKSKRIPQTKIAELYNLLQKQIRPIFDGIEDLENRANTDMESLISMVVTQSLSTWNPQHEESQAVKKAKDSLW